MSTQAGLILPKPHISGELWGVTSLGMEGMQQPVPGDASHFPWQVSAGALKLVPSHGARNSGASGDAGSWHASRKKRVRKEAGKDAAEIIPQVEVAA